MYCGTNTHVLRFIEGGSFWIHDAPPFQEPAALEAAVGLGALKDGERIVRQKEGHHKAAPNTNALVAAVHSSAEIPKNQMHA